MVNITLNEEAIATQAEQLFEGATLAKKLADPVTVLRNDSDKAVLFDVVLKDGTLESQGASIPPNDVAVVQIGGEINVPLDFSNLYEKLQLSVGTDLVAHANSAIEKAGIDSEQSDSLTKLTATPKQRVDKYLKLPTTENGESIDFVIMKPWGENGSMIPQEAKSGDVLVLNEEAKESYFNGINGTLGNFVNEETGKAIPEELDSMKTAPLADLVRAAEQGEAPDGQGQGGTQSVASQNKNKNKRVG